MSRPADDRQTRSLLLGRAGATTLAVTLAALLVAGACSAKGHTSVRTTTAASSTAPPAAANLLTSVAATDVKLTSTSADARITGRDANLRLSGYGVVTGFGAGAAERSAAVGYKLVGFAFYVSGTGYSLPPAPHPRVAVSVDGRAPRSIPYPATLATNQYYVMSVPTAAHAVDLQLTDGGFTQDISLLTGKPAYNIAVYRRTNAYDSTPHTGKATARVSRERAEDTTLTIRATSAHLEFFTPQGLHPSGPQRAFLNVNLCYTSSAALDPTKCFGFLGTDLQITPAGGQPITGRNISVDNTVYDVFDVPASFTTGTLTVTGSETGPDGLRLTITSPYSYRITIPA